jgi:SAM-dependent methyltransferase
LTTIPSLNNDILWKLFKLNSSLGIVKFIKGIDYVRTIEYPIIADEILKWCCKNTNYLDIGTGESILPIFIGLESQANITVVDKFSWVQKQIKFINKLGKKGWLEEKRFVVIEDDFLNITNLKQESIDIITAVSVIEHIEGRGDSLAIGKIYSLLKPGGRLLISVPYNHNSDNEFYVKKEVYGHGNKDEFTFYQRHYSLISLQKRIIEAAPFKVNALFYASNYDNFNFAKRLYMLPFPINLIKIFYNWGTPFYVPRFLKVSNKPPIDRKPKMLTADTAFVFLRKEY